MLLSSKHLGPAAVLGTLMLCMLLLGLLRHNGLSAEELQQLQMAHDDRFSVRREDILAALIQDSDPLEDPDLPPEHAMSLNITRLYAHQEGLPDDRDDDDEDVDLQDSPSTPDVGWRPLTREVRWRWNETAVISVDMWNTHPDQFFLQSVLELAPLLNDTLNILRDQGALIVHAPAGCMDFYRNHPARRRAQRYRNVAMSPIDRRFPLDKFLADYEPFGIRGEPGWPGMKPSEIPHRQVELIWIDPERDLISAEDGWWPMRSPEMHALLHGNGIRNVLVVGTALNICVLQRPFSVQAALTWGFNVAIVGDRTRAYANPLLPPYVEPNLHNQIVLEYVQKFIVGSCNHEDIAQSAQAAQVAQASYGS